MHGLRVAEMTLTVTVLLAIVATLGLNGCSVVHSLQTEPGVDISAVHPGASRHQVETVVGAPVRQWKTAAGVNYCVYEYFGGKDPAYLAATGQVFLDIATLGIGEAIYATDPKALERATAPSRKVGVIAVSYDANGKVIGVFPNYTQFTALPPDGQPAEKGVSTGGPSSR